jgi:hypothetical protein
LPDLFFSDRKVVRGGGILRSESVLEIVDRFVIPRYTGDRIVFGFQLKRFGRLGFRSKFPSSRRSKLIPLDQFFLAEESIERTFPARVDQDRREKKLGHSTTEAVLKRASLARLAMARPALLAGSDSSAHTSALCFSYSFGRSRASNKETRKC